jgi:hypothetical protein
MHIVVLSGDASIILRKRSLPMSSNTALFSGPPMASIEMLVAVYPSAVVTLFSVITTSFPMLVTACSRPVYIAFVVMVSGLCLLAKKPTATAIATRLGVVSHDALTRMLTHACWTASLLMNALVNQALLCQTGSVLPSVLICDDVLIPKPCARWIAGAYWDWDHAQHRRTYGHRIVVVVWTNGIMVVPVAFALWHKRHSAYFLAPEAVFADSEYQQFLTRFPDMAVVLSPLMHTENDTHTLAVNEVKPWQRALIPKTAWSVIAEHAGVKGRHYRTKNELARCLIYLVVRKGVSCDFITFDSWYASKENLNMLTRLGLSYVTALPCSRKLASARRVQSGDEVITSSQRVDATAAMFATRDFIPYGREKIRAMRLLVSLHGLRHGAALTIIKRQDWHGFLRKILPTNHPIHKHPKPAPNIYLLTNAVDWSTCWTLRSYRMRWLIECLFRDAKQHLGLGACQHRSLKAVTRHIALVFFAAVCLQLIRRQFAQSQPEHFTDMTIGEVKKRLQSQVLISGSCVEPSGMLSGELRPMPRETFERITNPAGPEVIGNSTLMVLESPAIKELYTDA